MAARCPSQRLLFARPATTVGAENMAAGRTCEDGEIVGYEYSGE